MTRATHGIERLDYNTYTVLIGGLGDVPEDVGINLKTWYFAPRLGAMYRLSDKSVMRAGYGRTINPLPWSRPMRGSFPYDINFNRTADQFRAVGTLASGIPEVTVPDVSSGRVKLPQGVFMRSPNPDQLDRGVIQQWNVAYEHRLPGDISAEVAYVGTRTDGGYADLNVNYGVPGGGNASRQYFAVAGTTAINDWAARTKSRYHGLQLSVNRPFKAGVALKGAYTYSQSKNMADEDGWVGLTWNTPLMYDRNYALAGFDRPHVFQIGFVWETPFMKNGTSVAARLLQGWQLNGILGAFAPGAARSSRPALSTRGGGPPACHRTSPAGSRPVFLVLHRFRDHVLDGPDRRACPVAGCLAACNRLHQGASPASWGPRYDQFRGWRGRTRLWLYTVPKRGCAMPTIAYDVPLFGDGVRKRP